VKKKAPDGQNAGIYIQQIDLECEEKSPGRAKSKISRNRLTRKSLARMLPESARNRLTRKSPARMLPESAVPEPTKVGNFRRIPHGCSFSYGCNTAALPVL